MYRIIDILNISPSKYSYAINGQGDKISNIPLTIVHAPPTIYGIVCDFNIFLYLFVAFILLSKVIKIDLSYVVFCNCIKHHFIIFVVIHVHNIYTDLNPNYSILSKMVIMLIVFYEYIIANFTDNKFNSIQYRYQHLHQICLFRDIVFFLFFIIMSLTYASFTYTFNDSLCL